MKTTIFYHAVLLILFFTISVYSHCDAVDGPVVKSAVKALEQEDVSLVLIWVQKDDEDEIIDAFNKTLEIRKIKSAKEFADNYFFETLVRVHRKGEGAPYTGLKPAGGEIEEGVKLADEALENNNIKQLEHFIHHRIINNLHEKFSKAVKEKSYSQNNVEEGREFVAAYVDFIHYVEALSKLIKADEHIEHHNH
jgi:hypothetical protein